MLEAREAQIRDWNKLRWLILVGNILPIVAHRFMPNMSLMNWGLDIIQAIVGISIWYLLTKKRKEYITKIARFKLTGAWHD